MFKNRITSICFDRILVNIIIDICIRNLFFIGICIHNQYKNIYETPNFFDKDIRYIITSLFCQNLITHEQVQTCWEQK